MNPPGDHVEQPAEREDGQGRDDRPAAPAPQPKRAVQHEEEHRRRRATATPVASRPSTRHWPPRPGACLLLASRPGGRRSGCRSGAVAGSCFSANVASREGEGGGLRGEKGGGGGMSGRGGGEGGGGGGGGGGTRPRSGVSGAEAPRTWLRSWRKGTRGGGGGGGPVGRATRGHDESPDPGARGGGGGEWMGGGGGGGGWGSLQGRGGREGRGGEGGGARGGGRSEGGESGELRRGTRRASPPTSRPPPLSEVRAAGSPGGGGPFTGPGGRRGWGDGAGSFPRAATGVVGAGNRAGSRAPGCGRRCPATPGGVSGAAPLSESERAAPVFPTVAESRVDLARPGPPRGLPAALRWLVAWRMLWRMAASSGGFVH